MSEQSWFDFKTQSQIRQYKCTEMLTDGLIDYSQENRKLLPLDFKFFSV